MSDPGDDLFDHDDYPEGFGEDPTMSESETMRPTDPERIWLGPRCEEKTSAGAAKQWLFLDDGSPYADEDTRALVNETLGDTAPLAHAAEARIRADERERAAKIAEQWDTGSIAARRIAAAIRKGATDAERT